MIDPDFAEAGHLLSLLLAASLAPSGVDHHGVSWHGARRPDLWEHNALCWLARNRAAGRVPLTNVFTAGLIEAGYPPRRFRDAQGIEREAGHYWRADMAPR